MSILTPGVNGKEIPKDYNTIFVHEGTDEVRAKLEAFIAKKIGEDLVVHYPNRQWGVEVDVPGQMVTILCPSVSLTKGYHIHMRKHTIHGLQERARTAAGEILERHNLSRARVFDPTILESLKRDSKDDVIATDSKAERY